MLKLERTNSENHDFQALVTKLDKDLKIRDGDEHAFYAQYNKLDSIKNVVVCYKENVPVGCGAFKHYDPSTVEIKRMWVNIESRGQGIASEVLKELENWAREMDYNGCILETGNKQPEAIALYRKAGYAVIPNFGQYENVANSVCMKKEI